MPARFSGTLPEGKHVRFDHFPTDEEIAKLSENVYGLSTKNKNDKTKEEEPNDRIEN